MKGIIIYEDYRGKKVVEAIKLGEVVYNCKLGSSDDFWINELSGIREESTQAYCNESDTYDFETGALIALMKLCGVEKVKKAAKETFFDVAENSVNEYEEKIDSLEKEIKRLRGVTEDFYKFNCRLVDEKEELMTDRNRSWKNYLEEEVEKLKLDCEKLQHGYNNTDMIFCGGRQNGKQYTALVELFKKIDQKKVDEAYKEAYNTTLPVWQKEVFKQLRKDQLDSLLEAGKYVVPTKREEMWGKILGDYKHGEKLSVKVEKAFINDFLQEAEDNGLIWANGGEKPTEWNRWESWCRRDYIVFRVHNWGKTKELSWCCSSDENTINYLPPMRWDLFKKGRLAVKVNYDNYKEFYEACKKELGKKPSCMFTGDFTVSICKKDGNFEIFTIEDQKKTGRKIVNWEDVR